MRNITTGDIMAILGVLILVGVLILGMLKYTPHAKLDAWNGGVKTIEYNGHEYLHFFSHGLTHNPDCPCKKKGE